MKALARPGVARVPGGRATPGDRKIKNNMKMALHLVMAALFLAGVAVGLALASLIT